MRQKRNSFNSYFDWEYILHHDQVVNAIKNALGMHKHQVKRPIIQAIDQHAFNNFVLDYSTDSAAAANTYYGIFESDVLIAVLGFVDQQCVKIVNNSDYNISYESIFEQLQWPIIQTNLNEIDINVFTKMGYKPVEYSLNKPYYANAYIDKTLQKPKQQTSCISDAGQVILVQH